MNQPLLIGTAAICTTAALAFGAGYVKGAAGVTCPAAVTTQHAEQQDLTARRITSVVTKYITVPGKAPQPSVVTKTVIEQPKESAYASTVSLTSPVMALTRYSLGVGCVALPCTRFSSVELQGSVRLGDLPLHVYTSFQPSTTRLSIGLRYEF